MDNVIRICAESLGANPSSGISNERWRVTDYVTGETYAESVRLPFFDTARALIKQGFEPSMRLMLVDKVTGMPRIHQGLGDAAGMSVKEPPSREGMRFVKFEEHPNLKQA
jgi:hypothetical protein